MKQIFGKILISLLVAIPILTYAAQAPKSVEELTKDSILIVSGKVIEVTSSTGSARVDPGFLNKDKFFTIKLKVSKVSKGSGVKPGETITIITWKAYSRPFWHAGPQGMDTIAQKGDSVTVYIKGKDGTNYKPILPNGIVISEKEK